MSIHCILFEAEMVPSLASGSPSGRFLCFLLYSARGLFGVSLPGMSRGFICVLNMDLDLELVISPGIAGSFQVEDAI